MGIEFRVAAAAERGEEDVVEVDMGGELGVVEARRITSAQAEILASRIRQYPTLGALDMIEAFMGSDVREYLYDLLMKGAIDRNDLIGGWGENDEGRNEQGLLDQLIAQFTGRPTAPSTGSSRSQSTGGRRSTARTPGKGSTRSSSPSTDS